VASTECRVKLFSDSSAVSKEYGVDEGNIGTHYVPTSSYALGQSPAVPFPSLLRLS
jgi:hypothetical protein